MLPKADSAEFANLLDRWLDDAATAEEAELFWRCVRESRECALAFGAAARFEGLLTDTVKALDVEAEARKVLAVPTRLSTDPITTRSSSTHTSRGTPRPVPQQQPIPMRAFAIAAAIVVLGLVTAMLWPEENGTPKVSKSAVPAPTPVKPVDIITAPPALTQAPEAATVSKIDMTAPEPRLAGGPEFVEIPLTAQLDGFWLSGVSLDNVPLSQAIAMLRGLLERADAKNALPLDKLEVFVHTGAVNRRVTFHSESIPYLKALRAVAALAGCEVEVADQSVTLQLIPGIFPQVAEKRTLGEMLADRVNADGSPMASNEARLTQLWNDAARLGITVAADGTANISRGQWQALAMMTDSRDQLSAANKHAFAVYLVPEGQIPESGVLTAEQTEQLQKSLIEDGVQPIAIVVPETNPPDNPRPLISATFDGDRISYSAADAPGVSQTMPIGSQEAPVGLVVAGRNITFNSNSGVTALGSSGNSPNMVYLSNNGNNTIRGTLVMLPTPAGVITVNPNPGGSPP